MDFEKIAGQDLLDYGQRLANMQYPVLTDQAGTDIVGFHIENVAGLKIIPLCALSGKYQVWLRAAGA